MSIFPSASHGKEKGNLRVEGATTLTAQVTGILFVTFSVLMFLSVMSFFPNDAILFDWLWGAGRSGSATPLHNWIGIVGSTMAF